MAALTEAFSESTDEWALMMLGMWKVVKQEQEQAVRGSPLRARLRSGCTDGARNIHLLFRTRRAFPGLAASGERGWTFRASLEQLEDLEDV